MCTKKTCVCWFYEPKFTLTQIRHMEETVGEFDVAMRRGRGSIYLDDFLRDWLRRWPIRTGGRTLTARIAYCRRTISACKAVEVEYVTRLFCYQKNMTRRELAIWMSLRIGELFRERDRVAREECELREAMEAAELFQTGDEDSGDESGDVTSWEVEESLSGDGNSLEDDGDANGDGDGTHFDAEDSDREVEEGYLDDPVFLPFEL
ncbi:hypothetical protein EST38_g12465 [Candolleomyces aberdarensis]|uniref:Uncharacterized protein n=1 Tax=Candolleomyces aberdarensis TaxID=2316362 RepID=A0A4Q2D2B6_9AGAR|nr:hypothetical protein EST38_g12465 [Candolleomyces aberdarensis]